VEHCEWGKTQRSRDLGTPNLFSARAAFKLFCKSSRCISRNPGQLQMAHPLPRFFSRRFCQRSSPFSKASNSFPRRFQANSAPRRSYATGESGPNPRPGQSPFKIWPFVAITVAGSGAYILMVRSRVGMRRRLLSFQLHLFSSEAQPRKPL